MSLRAWLGLAIIVSAVGACDTPTKWNHFVLPTAYRGPIALVSDPSFESDSYWDGKRFVHRVPATAIVCVKSDDVIRPLFRTSAVYVDGTPIYASVSGFPGPPNTQSPRIDAIGSWGSSSEDGYIHWFAVGSAAEVAALTSRFFGAGGGIELAMPDGVKIEKTRNEEFAYLRQYCSKQ